MPDSVNHNAALAAAILDVLPQTQCTQCGYPDCAAYAAAIAAGAAINQCPPGGAAGIAVLSQLTGQTIRPLNPEHGIEQPLRVAVIDESLCIGCTKCIQACPVDAIVGGRQMMHTVIDARCTGCALCVPPCPMDCIALPVAGREWDAASAAQARWQYAARSERLPLEAARRQTQRLHQLEAKQAQLLQEPSSTDEGTDPAHAQAVVAAALARARARRAANP